MKSMKVLFTAVLVLSLALGFGGAALADTYEVALIVKATDSDFWQVVLRGGETAGMELDNVNVTTYGPVSEADIAEQVAILENVITARPDAIVIASTSSDATIPAIELAYERGIKIILIDNLVHTDSYHSFLATDNRVGGALAAEMFVHYAEEMGRGLEGKVGHVSAMAGVQVLIDRDAGFFERLEELAPGLEVLSTRFVDNHIPLALGAAEDVLTANPDLIGFFANNNHTGIGVGRAVVEGNLHDQIVLVAYDSDPEQVTQLLEGAIKALVVQDPFRMGYQGVHDALRAIMGEELERFVDTGVVVVTAENYEDDTVQELIDPELRRARILGE